MRVSPSTVKREEFGSILGKVTWAAEYPSTSRGMVRLLGNEALAQKLMAELTQQFPTPRVQTDDGNQDVADLHAREDLLLEYYTRVDGKPGTVRIPIERAMELVAQRGLPAAP